MKKFSKPLPLVLLIIFLAVIFSIQGFAQDQKKQPTKISLDSWLCAGPFAMQLPAFSDDNNRKHALEEMLKFSEIDLSLIRPAANLPLQWRDSTTTQWKELQSRGQEIKLTGPADNLSLAYLGTYINVTRWTQAKLILHSPQMLLIYLNGRLLATKTITGKNNNSQNGQKISQDITLETGKHLLLIKTLQDPQNNSDWTISASLSVEERFASPPPENTLDPNRTMSIPLLLDGPKPTSISLSPQGDMAALTVRQTLPPSDSSESWIQLYQVSNKRLLRTFRGKNSLSNVTWAPSGHKFSYISYNDTGGTLWVVDLDQGTSRPLLKNIKNLGGHTWSPDSSFIIYSVSQEGKKDRPGVKRFINMSDRQPGWRDRSYLYKLNLISGVKQRLTMGELSTYLNSISPDCGKLLFTCSLIDYTSRPYSQTELYELDLQTLEARLLLKGPWINNAQWSPQGDKILILGGPSAFGELGVNVPNGVIPNEYDTQAYLYDPGTKAAEPFTKDFNPSINQAIWSRNENVLYFTTTDRSYVRLYKYDLEKKKFTSINCGVNVVGRFNMAREKPVAVYIGSSAADPPKAYLIDLDSKKFQIFLDPSKNDFAHVRMGRVERWTFKNKKGTEIEGRIYYPPGFNPQKKYPLIVNYYGGTAPVTRNFGGRYPLNVYAAQGYVVYVLQPSGATGFGQAFSALHVNDWGLIVAEEIIDGVKKFLSAHPFVDSERIGCIGASFGGFMTMLLQTRTNIFTTAIAHAGISSIASYWGEGYWGYLYSAIATANSFPWNRKDIYINQSPLFNADKISTPLLLLHGSVDTNVPPGESTQLFTALKLLGREVEYIQIMDQNHHIMTYNKRILWTKTILAWFDRWLKRQPEWWESLYPK